MQLRARFLDDDRSLAGPAALRPRIGEALPCRRRSCGHLFVTSQGSAHARFRRALATGNPLLVRAAAAELNSISLADALSICLVLLRAEPTRYGRAAARFHARLVQDVARVELEDAQIALAALQGLRGPDPAGAGGALAELFAALDLADLQQRLEAWLRVSPPS
jgi:hypothetical protein